MKGGLLVGTLRSMLSGVSTDRVKACGLHQAQVVLWTLNRR